ncbi:hypothetical protein PHLGIDRAFT_444254 [Phlebiopsis gigantea 11061_1 CR5-6]|uniref:Uncharacterized protein n=1 Tax=Phlebiopsis gigantea (strain 11061_1 CR5-6) TaxID=745531 RepID=A0A0C3RXY4_PHLG1|nr:hypothetical protein PHLGIDRAFT_444254 [Phlebiopsis gigantea 11061_1 CR5-6]
MNRYHRQLQDRIKNLKGKLDTALGTIEEKDQQLADCKRAYDELHADYDSLNKSHEELKKKYDELQNQLLKLSEQIATTSAELIKCRHHCAELQKQLTDEKAKAQDLANKNAALQGELDQERAKVDQLQTQLNAANATAESLRQQNASLQNQLTTATKLADTYHNNYLQSEAKLSAVTRQRDELQRKLDALEKVKPTPNPGPVLPPGVPAGMTNRGIVISGSPYWEQNYKGFFNTQTGDIVYSDCVPRQANTAAWRVNSQAYWGYNTRTGATGYVSSNPCDLYKVELKSGEDRYERRFTSKLCR